MSLVNALWHHAVFGMVLFMCLEENSIEKLLVKPYHTIAFLIMNYQGNAECKHLHECLHPGEAGQIRQAGEANPLPQNMSKLDYMPVFGEYLNKSECKSSVLHTINKSWSGRVFLNKFDFNEHLCYIATII